MTEGTFTPLGGNPLAYCRTNGASKTLPGVMFMGGFRSDMTGTKATYIEAQCARRHQSFLRFDYSGHGKSGGQFEQQTISTWLRDSLSVFDKLTKGDQIVVGSSMGGWLALLLALERKERVKGLVLIAPAPDFSEDIYQNEFGEEERRHLDKTGLIYRPSDYGDPYPLSKQLFEDGRKHLLLKNRIAIRCPVRILHGKQDSVVPWQKSVTLMDKLSSPDYKAIWINDGDHRLSRNSDLEHLDTLVRELSQLKRLEAAQE
ncbi:MAG TPA: alpha/beta hydrolase [Patescibacteria group bacterium]|nr:alpha/beta hydrolase [Patescibacteria group bacterium]